MKLQEEKIAEKINDLRKKRDAYIRRMNKQILKKKEELDKICTHSKTTVREENHEGGYDYVAQYHKIQECVFCEKELDRKTTYGSYA